MEHELTNPSHAMEQSLTGDQLYSHAANLLLNHNKNSYEVKTSLMAKGVEEKDAVYIIDRLEQQIDDARKKKANKDMLYGALWCIGGTIVTVYSYSAASEGGGRYMVAWGAIIFGGVQFVRGLIASTK